MGLSILDVLDTSEVERLLNNNVQYSSLVKCYQSISTSKIDLIAKHDTTFLDIIVEACSHDSDYFKSSKVTPKYLREQLNDALVQKITVGLMALGEVALNKISTTVFRMGKYFVSDSIITNICTNNTGKFSVKHTGSHSVVQIATAPVDEKKIRISEDIREERSRFSVQLRHLYRTNPEVIQALQPNPGWKHILSAYQYWNKYCRATSNLFFVDWLLKMSRLKCPIGSPQYEVDLNTILFDIIRKYLNSCFRSVQQITEHLCLARPQFISQQSVLAVVESDSRTYISNRTKGLPVHQKLVSLLNRVEKPHLDDDFQLPESVERRMLPLLTLRITWQTALNTFRLVMCSDKMKLLVEKYGCFLNYLLAYAEATKPRLSVVEFKQHLQSLLKPIILKCLDKHSNQGRLVRHILEEISPVGFMDYEFLRESAKCYSNEFRVDREIIACRIADDLTISEGNADEYRPIEGKRDPLSELESHRVLYLLEKLPRFADIVDVFASLPETSMSIMAISSMSFFEWLISLSKRIMPHDVPIFELHLQKMIQEEVLRIHARLRCQLTIHHVHSQLCLEHPMLLSPNFLRWCLEQPDSAFTLHQSWIYVKNSGRRLSIDASSSNHDISLSRRSPDSVPNRLLSAVSSCSELLDLFRIIKEVPLEQVGLIIQRNAYWYDFIENNVKDRKLRQKLAVLLAEEAKFRLGKRILRLTELVSSVSNGVANFVSADTLEYILRQQMGMFAFSRSLSENCRVGVVREMGDSGVECCDEQEENLMRQILLYVPTTGSCDVTTLLGLVTKEHSFLHNHNYSIDVDYLRCFFLIFPMLFYLRGDVVVLTCMALDRRNRYRVALHPTSATDTHEDRELVDRKRGRREKRSRTHRHRHKRKKRRRSSGNSPSIRDEEDESNTSSEVIAVVSHADSCIKSSTRTCIENHLVEDNKHEFLRSVIKELPTELITDVAGSLLISNEGQARADPLVSELLSKTVGSEECQQIRATKKLHSKFKARVLEVLNSSCKFSVYCRIDGDLETATNVVVVTDEEREERLASSSGTVRSWNGASSEKCVKQLDGAASTSGTQGLANADQISPNGGVGTNSKKCSGAKPSGKAIDTTPSAADVIKLLTYSPVYAGQASDYVSDTIEVDSEKAEEVPPTSVTPIAVYSSLPTSSFYKMEETSNHASKNQPNSSREELFMQCFNNYLEKNAGVCSTELLVSNAYERFQEERFARSRLAFEAYVYDFLVKYCQVFILSGTGCEFGVSRTIRGRISPNSSPQTSCPTNLFFMKFITSVCASCCVFLNAIPCKRSEIADLCEAINAEFSDHLGIFSDDEVAAVVRCLVLVALIRNLKLFCFSVDEQSVYLRNRKESEVKEATLSHHSKLEMEGIRQNATTREAVLLMADILQTYRPSSRTALRDLWQSRAPVSVANVFGTGISFTLSLRKYSFLFPSFPDGSIKVDESAIKYIKTEG